LHKSYRKEQYLLLTTFVTSALVIGSKLYDNMMSFVECTYNNSYHASIVMTPFEALYEGSVKLHYVGFNMERIFLWDLIF